MEDIISYLCKFEIRPDVIDKITKAIDICKDNFNIKIGDIFLSEYVDVDNKKFIYEDLFIISEDIIIKLGNLNSLNFYNLAGYPNKIFSWNIDSENFDFNNKGHCLSKLFIHLQLYNGLTICLKASKDNCDKLKSIFVNYLLPNVVK